MRKLLVLLAAAIGGFSLLLGGCSTSSLRKGETTFSEMRQNFGEPRTIRMKKNGNKTAVWEIEQTAHASNVNRPKQTIVAEFNSEGVLIKSRRYGSLHPSSDVPYREPLEK